MSTQLMQQEEDDGDLQSSATGRQPRPRRRRITYRLTLSLRVWRTRFSLIFAFSAGKLREPERQRPALRVVGLQEAEPMMLMADGQTDGGDSTSGASGSIT